MRASSPFFSRAAFLSGVLLLVGQFVPTAMAQDRASGATQGRATACAQHFLAGAPPAVVRPAMLNGARELCNDEFAVLHSARSRGPLYAAEYLTTQKIRAARELEREELFHEEERLSSNDRASLSDYRRSGFDRGHVAPSGNMATAASRYQSFSLANMVPQNPDNNQRIWCSIESTVRDIAVQNGEAWVVTGPLFLGANVATLGGRVFVPTHLYKAVYTKQGIAGVYLTANREGGLWQAISLNDLADLSGIDAFPSLPNQQKLAPPTIPQPNRLCRGAVAQQGQVLADLPRAHQFANTSAPSPNASAPVGLAAQGAQKLEHITQEANRLLRTLQGAR